MITLSLLAVERRLEPDCDRFLADVEVAEAADQAEAVKLPGLLLEAADQQHLLVEFEQLGVARPLAVLVELVLQAVEGEVVSSCSGRRMRQFLALAAGLAPVSTGGSAKAFLPARACAPPISATREHAQRFAWRLPIADGKDAAIGSRSSRARARPRRDGPR